MSRTDRRQGRKVAGGLVALLVAAGSVGGLAAPAHALTPTAITLLSVNDFHGRINATTVDFAKTIEKLRQDSLIANAGVDNTLLVGAGDLIGASDFPSAVQQDQPTIDVMNALGMASSAVGNHEFDQGFADLTDRVIDGGANAQWDYLGANVYDSTTGQPVLPEYSLSEVNGLTVGVIGAVTQETPTLVSPGGVANLTFGDPVEAVNRVAAQLTDGDETNGEADVLVASYHEGAAAGETNGGTLESQLAASVVFNDIVTGTSPSVAAILNGHTHQVYAWDAPVPGAADGVTRPIIQTGNYADNVGQIQLTVDADTNAILGYTAANVPRATADTPVVFDPTLGEPASIAEITSIVDAALAYATEVGSTPIGEVTADITTAFSGGDYSSGVYGPTADPAAPAPVRDNRAAESALGNLVADSLLDSLSAPDRGGAEIALVNPGGLRADLRYAPDGTLTYAEANSVLPFLNNLFTTTLTGAQLDAVLEEQWQTDAMGAVPSRPYLQLGLSENVTYTYDPDPDGDGVVVGDLDDTGQHVSAIFVDGQPVSDADTFRVGTFSFLLQGGDNFRTLATGTDPRDSGLIDRDAWIAYLTEASPVTPSFAKKGVAVTGLPETPVAGEALAFSVSNLDITSLGAPANTELSIAIDGGPDLGTVPVTAGAASVDVVLPDGIEGEQTLVLSSAASETVVRIPVTISAAVAAPSTITATAPSVAVGTAPVVAVTVTSEGGTPEGEITVSEGDTVWATGVLEEGSATLTLPADAFPAGTRTLTVAYSGSDSIAPSAVAVDLVVTGAAPVTPAPTPSPTAGGGTLPATGGGDATGVALFGAALLAAGLGAFLLRRRTRLR